MDNTDKMAEYLRQNERIREEGGGGGSGENEVHMNKKRQTTFVNYANASIAIKQTESK